MDLHLHRVHFLVIGLLSTTATRQSTLRTAVDSIYELDEKPALSHLVNSHASAIAMPLHRYTCLNYTSPGKLRTLTHYNIKLRLEICDNNLLLNLCLKEEQL